jgi:tetratricopeptide (TPR) repeat protein
MNPRHPPKPIHSPARPASAAPDAFVLAGARLAAQRPLRSNRLQRIEAQLQSQQIRQAEEALAAYLDQEPDDADAIHLMARVALRQKDAARAIALWQRGLALVPDFTLARFNLANLQVQQSRFAEALAEAERLLTKDGQNPLFRQLKAGILESTGETAQAIALYRQLASENPRRAEAWIHYGHALRAAGSRDECIVAYRRAIECRPSFGQAYWDMANLRNFAFDDDDIHAMQVQLGRSELSPADRTPLQFSLAKAHEDQGAYALSFEQYQAGNAALRQRIKYDSRTLTESVAHHKALFTPAFYEDRRDAGCPAPDPIFVLGRPRSGSTLVEQMLSSHSAIEGTAELPYIRQLTEQLNERKDVAFGAEYLQALHKLLPPELTALGDQYLQRARQHRQSARPFFIDKMPANFLHIGMIRLMLPNAKIIDVRRHPVACCLSIFKSYSSKGRLDLAELGRFYRDYVDLMAHFDRALPGRVHRVTYESLIHEPQAELSKLLNHLGLPFEDACLRFHETQRTVLTPSSEQVRRPLYTEAIDHWRHFEPWLAPLIDSLGSVLSAYPSVPAEMG